MSRSLVIGLICFSIVWIIVIIHLLKNDRITIKYSLVWFLMALVLFLVGITPKMMSFIASKVGFLTTANLVIAIILSLLLIITLILTMIVTNQKRQINKLIQEISIIKKDK